jgi:hypothetical protein
MGAATVCESALKRCSALFGTISVKWEQVKRVLQGYHTTVALGAFEPTTDQASVD